MSRASFPAPSFGVARESVCSTAVALSTDAETCPTWQNDEPVWLTLGARFQWKLVIAGGGSTRWERGDNRFDRAMAAAFETGPRVYGASLRR